MKFELLGYKLEISLTEKTGKYKSGVSRRLWTESEVNALLRFRNEGKSWKEVGKLLNRTDAACYMRHAKIHKSKK